MAGMSLRAVAVLAGLALLAVGCSSSHSSLAPRRFCETANRYETELEQEATNGKLDLAKQISIVEQLAAAAPAKVHADAETFLAALRRVDRDPHVRDDPAIKRAVDNVNRYASQRCGFFTQQPGGM
jgi:hypothetical protein